MYSLLKILFDASFRKYQHLSTLFFNEKYFQRNKTGKAEQCKIEQNKIEWDVHVYVNSINSSPKILSSFTPNLNTHKHMIF